MIATSLVVAMSKSDKEFEKIGEFLDAAISKVMAAHEELAVAQAMIRELSTAELGKISQWAALAKDLGEKHAISKSLTTDLHMTAQSILYNTLPILMEDQGIENVRIDGVGLVRIASELHASISKEEGAGGSTAVMEWLEEIGQQGAITATVNSSTLSAIVRKRVEKGDEIPPCVSIRSNTVARITK